MESPSNSYDPPRPSITGGCRSTKLRRWHFWFRINCETLIEPKLFIDDNSEEENCFKFWTGCGRILCRLKSRQRIQNACFGDKDMSNLTWRATNRKHCQVIVCPVDSMPNAISSASFSVLMTTRQLDLKCIFLRNENEKESRIYNNDEWIELTELNVLFFSIFFHKCGLFINFVELEVCNPF